MAQKLVNRHPFNAEYLENEHRTPFLLGKSELENATLNKLVEISNLAM